jgi:hypothetical protein
MEGIGVRKFQKEDCPEHGDSDFLDTVAKES